MWICSLLKQSHHETGNVKQESGSTESWEEIQTEVCLREKREYGSLSSWKTAKKKKPAERGEGRTPDRHSPGTHNSRTCQTHWRAAPRRSCDMSGIKTHKLLKPKKHGTRGMSSSRQSCSKQRVKVVSGQIICHLWIKQAVNPSVSLPECVHH